MTHHREGWNDDSNRQARPVIHHEIVWHSVGKRARYAVPEPHKLRCCEGLANVPSP